MDSALLPNDPEERLCFEWFMHHTARKVPGMFAFTPFWPKLVLQTSLSEPAVWHAILILSSIHRRGVSIDGSQREGVEIPDKQEQFILRHYVRAIRHLQPHFLAKDKTSIRIALITCVIFVYLEFLNGRFKTALIHLRNGLRILNEMPIFSKAHDFANGEDDRVEDKCLQSSISNSLVDEWIFEAFSRLNVQVLLFTHPNRTSKSVLWTSKFTSPICAFSSINEAWQQMEQIFFEIFSLTEEARQYQVPSKSPRRHTLSLADRQQRVWTELTQWFHSYERSKKEPTVQEPQIIAWQVLCNYHAMANIMMEVCLSFGDDSIFDSLTQHFASIVSQSAMMRELKSWNPQVRPLSGPLLNMSRSIVDIGWIPPLYYTALKCRIPQLRSQAINLLESTSHREGIWDTGIAACVARKIVEIEESGSFIEGDIADDIWFPSSSNSLQPTIPHSCRLNEVEVNLPDDPSDPLILLCRKQHSSRYLKVVMKDFNVLSEHWLCEQNVNEEEEA